MELRRIASGCEAGAHLNAAGRRPGAGGGRNYTGILNSVELYDRVPDFEMSRQPVISEAPETLKLNQAIVLTGAGFRGVAEASGSGTKNSASNHPLVQLRRIDNEHVHYLVPDAAGWSDTSFVSMPLEELQIGPALLTVITNGIPSLSRVVKLGTISKCGFYVVTGLNGKTVVVCL